MLPTYNEREHPQLLVPLIGGAFGHVAHDTPVADHPSVVGRRAS